MGQNSSGQANIYYASEEIPKFYGIRRTHNRPLVSVLSQMNSVHSFPFSVFTPL
jgi:hypothetical protein